MATFLENRYSNELGAANEEQKDASLETGTYDEAFVISAKVPPTFDRMAPASEGVVGFALDVFDVERLFVACRQYLREHGHKAALFLGDDELKKLPVGAAYIMRHHRSEKLGVVVGHDGAGFPYGRLWNRHSGSWQKSHTPLSCVTRVASADDGQARNVYQLTVKGESVPILYAEDLGLRPTVVWQDHPEFIDYYIADYRQRRLVVTDNMWQVFPEEGMGLPLMGNHAENLDEAKRSAVAWVDDQLGELQRTVAEARL